MSPDRWAKYAEKKIRPLSYLEVRKSKTNKQTDILYYRAASFSSKKEIIYLILSLHQYPNILSYLRH